MTISIEIVKNTTFVGLSEKLKSPPWKYIYPFLNKESLIKKQIKDEITGNLNWRKIIDPISLSY